MRSPLWVVGQGYLREPQNTGYCYCPLLPPKGWRMSLLLNTPCAVDTGPSGSKLVLTWKLSAWGLAAMVPELKVPLFASLPACCVRSCTSFSYTELWKLKLLQPSCLPYHEGLKSSEIVNQISLPSQVFLSLKWEK